MKFIMDTYTFKTSAERAMAIREKSYLPFVEQMGIFADGHEITFKAYNGNEYVAITADATVIDPGYVYVSFDAVRKLFNIKGEYITIENSDSTTLEVSGEKKKSEVPAIIPEENIFASSMPTASGDAVMKMTREDLLTVLDNLSRFMVSGSRNLMMNGYHFTNERIETLDSHRIGIKWVDWNQSDKKIDAVIPGQMYKHIKKVIGKVLGTKINLYLDDKYARFEGYDNVLATKFEYTIKLIEGIYFNVDSMLGKYGDYKYHLTVNADDITEVAKEYYSMVKHEDKPMLWYLSNGKLMTSLFLSDYRTVDEINVGKIYAFSDDMIIGFRPEFIKDATEIFSGEIEIRLIDQRKPLHIEKDDYHIIVLPVNINGQEVSEKIENLIKN